MKTILISLFVTFSMVCRGQNLEGFLGFKFGLDADSIKKAMLMKPGCKLDQENSKKNILIFKGVMFAGRETQFISFEFVNNKFYLATVMINPPSEFKTVSMYTDIRSELTTKYAGPAKTVETYDPPYKKNDGQTEVGIKLGKAHFESYWYFKNPKSARKDIVNSISLSINFKMQIKIEYQDGVLNNEAQELLKKKNVQDY